MDTSYALLSFHKSDTVRFLQFPEELYIGIQPYILASWPPGIQNSGPFTEHPNSRQLKLKGFPFGWSRGQDTVGGARLVRDIFAFMHHSGWELVMPFSRSRQPGTKDVLIFRPRPLEAPPAQELECEYRSEQISSYVGISSCLGSKSSLPPPGTPENPLKMENICSYLPQGWWWLPWPPTSYTSLATRSPS